MPQTTTPPAETQDTRTVIAFSDDDDHCHYDPAAILSSLTDAENKIISAHFPDAASSWTTSTDLYCASEELEELGHDDLAAVVGQFIHAEQIYECICRNQAFEQFLDVVGSVARVTEGRFPHITWWTKDRVHDFGLGIEELLTDFGRSSTNQDPVTFIFDENGDVTVSAEGRELRAQAFTSHELGTFVQHLGSYDVLATEERVDGRHLYASVEDWLALPETDRTLLAHLYVHDVTVAGGGSNTATGPRRARDLAFDQLHQHAGVIAALPEPARVALTSLLPDTDSTLEDLVEAVEAAFITS